MTTAAVVAYYGKESEAKVYYAGHPPVLYRRVLEKAWSFARPSNRKDKIDGSPSNIPLAVDTDAIYGQSTISMDTGDRLFIYTDGIIDAPDSKGECFGLERLKDVLDANPTVSISDLKYAVLRALHQYTKEGLNHDDVTMIALEIS